MNNLNAFLMTQLFTVVGLIMGAVALVIWLKSRAWRKRTSSRTTGRVIRNELHDMRRARYTYSNGRHSVSASCYFPVVEFETWNGDYVTVESNHGTGCEKYHAGDMVDVWYNRANPKEFRLDNYSIFVYVPVGILLCIGVFFVFFGVMFGVFAATGAISM